MPMDAHEIQSMIKAAIPDAEVTIRDLAGDGDHYAATVISESFRGKSRVQQHQIVYQSLKGQMGGVLHALALQTGVPEGASLRGCGDIFGWRGRIHVVRCIARTAPHVGVSRVTYAELFFDPGVRFRGHSRSTHTLLGPLDAARQAAANPAVPGGMVGVGFHLVDYQLAQSGDDAGSDFAVCADAGRARAVDLDSCWRLKSADCGSPWPTLRCRSAETIFLWDRRRLPQDLARRT